jgi:hypothetical protein
MSYFQMMDKGGGWHEYLGVSPEGVSREVFAEGDQISVFKGFSDFAYAQGYREIISSPGDKVEKNAVSWAKYSTVVGRSFTEVGSAAGVGAVKKLDGSDYTVTELMTFSELRNIAKNIRTQVGGSVDLSAQSFNAKFRAGFYVDSSTVSLDSQGAAKLAGSSMVVISSAMGTVFNKAVNFTSAFANGGKTSVALGDNESEVLLGRHITTVKAGKITNTVLAGTHDTSVTAGSISRKVAAGSISDEVTVGQYSQSATRVSIEGTAQVSVTSTVNVTVSSPTIILGDPSSGLPLPVLTIGNHYCNVTGTLPIPGLNGSKVVYAV